MVINLIAGIKMPYPEHLRNNLSHTERVQLDTNTATVACLRLDDKVRWCYEHIAPVGARAEMPASAMNLQQARSWGSPINMSMILTSTGRIDIGSTTHIEGEPYAPVGKVTQFFYRAASRGEQFRGDYQKLYDEGIQIALKYLGE